ncbi:MAG: hypothetical protein HYX78_13455 [Armatimonadetes bacterium]|nr:hypothetical protein [Armatimonadota bacterium]
MTAGRARGDLKPVHWIGSAKKDLKAFPDPVQDDVGLALMRVQIGLIPRNAKPLSPTYSRASAGFGRQAVRSNC